MENTSARTRSEISTMPRRMSLSVAAPLIQAYQDVHDPAKAMVAGIVAPVFTIVGLLVLLAGSPSLFTVIAVLGGLVLSGVALAQLSNDQANGTQIIFDKQVPNRTLWCAINVIVSLFAFIIYRLKNPDISTPPTAEEVAHTTVVSMASLSLWLAIFYFTVTGVFVWFDHMNGPQPEHQTPVADEAPMIARGAPTEHQQ